MTAAAIFAWSGGCLLAGTAIGWVIRGFRRDFDGSQLDMLRQNAPRRRT